MTLLAVFIAFNAGAFVGYLLAAVLTEHPPPHRRR